MTLIFARSLDELPKINTHTHTHIYIYIYVYIYGATSQSGPRLLIVEVSTSHIEPIGLL